MPFTLGGLALRLAAGIAAEEANRHHRLEKAAKLVEEEAKAEIGHYQDGAGTFGPWPELAERTKQTNVNNTPGLVTGGMRESIGHAVETHARGGEAAVGSNDPHLLYFELGTATQPPRSVLGLAVMHKEKEIVKLLGHDIVRTLIGGGKREDF